LNSPITIWLLTALLLTVGGGALTSYRQCVVEANDAIERHFDAKNELYYRQEYIAERVAIADSIADVREAFEKVPHYIARMKDSSSKEVMFIMMRTKRLIDESTNPFPDRATHIHQFRYTGRDLERYGGILNGHLRPDLTEAELPRLKYYVANEFKRGSQEIIAGLELQPQCNPFSNAANVLFGPSRRGPRKLIEYRPLPYSIGD